jgi:flagellar motor switch protein FliN/FliY
MTETQEQPDAPAQPSPSTDPSTNLDVIMDLDLPLTVRFGQTQMTLGSLVRLAAGSEINLERSPADPVELMVNGKVIARGEVVAVEGNYAVRITDIVSPSERIANVGG